MNFKGKAKRINDLDIPRIGSQIGVGEDELHAFMDVEAAGSGFDDQGRPKMLFEPHRFYAELPADKRDVATKQGLARKTWKINGRVPKYPSDSYPLLAKAIRIDEEAALRSCSWGLTQILGKWHKDIGYPSAKAMVLAFMDDEANHLDATVKLLVQWKVDDDLKARRWATVAEAWNGPSYRSHGYHTKLAKAFEKWSKIRNTVWPPADWKPEKPVLTPEMIDQLPAAPTADTEVITVPGPKKDETTVVVVDNPKHKPQPPSAKPPKSANGWAALVAIATALLAGIAKFFGG